MLVGVHHDFLEKLILSWWRHNCDATAIFSKNDVIYVMNILYIDLFFDTESQNG